jgi:predicted dehydrogenase
MAASGDVRGVSVDVVSPVSLAIVGCGAITRLAHLPYALRSTLIEVKALVDLTPESAEELRREYGLSTCRVARSVEEVLDEVDGVLIATPNHTHTALAEKVLTRGKPVLIEKPLTVAHADALKLCDLADAHKTFISVGFRSRQWAGVRLLKRLIDDGALGRLTGYDYEVGNTGGWIAVSGYSVRGDQAGGGTLIDAHVLDKLLFWFGEPASFTYADDAKGGVEANCKATLTYTSPGGNFSGTFFLSKTTELRNRIVVRGDRFTCRLDERENAFPVLTSADTPGYSFEVHSAGPAADSKKNSFVAQLDEFALAIRRKTPVTVDGRFAALSVKWTQALYGARTPLDEPWLLYQQARPAREAV